MTIYQKLVATSILFLIIMILLSYPETSYSKWLTKKCGDDYGTALIYSLLISSTPLITIFLIYVWFEL